MAKTQTTANPAQPPAMINLVETWSMVDDFPVATGVWYDNLKITWYVRPRTRPLFPYEHMLVPQYSRCPRCKAERPPATGECLSVDDWVSWHEPKCWAAGHEISDCACADELMGLTEGVALSAYLASKYGWTLDGRRAEMPRESWLMPSYMLPDCDLEGHGFLALGPSLDIGTDATVEGYYDLLEGTAVRRTLPRNSPPSAKSTRVLELVRLHSAFWSAVPDVSVDREHDAT